MYRRQRRGHQGKARGRGAKPQWETKSRKVPCPLQPADREGAGASASGWGGAQEKPGAPGGQLQHLRGAACRPQWEQRESKPEVGCGAYRRKGQEVSLLCVARVPVCGLQGVGGTPRLPRVPGTPRYCRAHECRCRGATDLGRPEVHVWAELGESPGGKG